MKNMQTREKPQTLSRHNGSAIKARICSVARICFVLIMCSSLLVVCHHKAMARAEQAPREQYITTGTPGTAACRWRLIIVPGAAAALILLDGRDAATPGHDDGDVSTEDKNRLGFLKGNAEAFAEQGFLVALPAEPVPEAKKNTGSKNSDEYAESIAAVVSHITETSRIPVWIIGMDTGTLPAVSYAADARDAIAGVVLLAPPVRFRNSILDIYPSRSRRGILAGPLDSITAPILLVTHRKDDCYESPPSGILMIRNRLRRVHYFDIMYIRAECSSEGNGDPCGPSSFHCFSGMDEIVVSKISRYIGSRSER